IADGITETRVDLNNTPVNVVGSHGRLFVTSSTPFSATPGTNGYVARIVKASDPSKTQLVTVQSIAGAQEIHTNEQIDDGYGLGDHCYPLSGPTLPTVRLNIDQGENVSLDVDLEGVYSA